MANAGHPDDIEFQMAGALLLHMEAGLEIHYLNLSNGNCGEGPLNLGRWVPRGPAASD